MQSLRFELEVVTASMQLSDYSDHQTLLFPLMQHIDRVLGATNQQFQRDFHAMDYGYSLRRLELESVRIIDLELGNEGLPGWTVVYSLYAEIDIQRDIFEVA
jgi:hypothetical protein